LLVVAPRLAPAQQDAGVGNSAASEAAAHDSGAPKPHERTGHSRTWWIGGAFLVGTAAMLPLDRHLEAVLHADRLQSSNTLRSAVGAFNWLGGAGVLALEAGALAVGRVSGHESLAAAGLRGTEAIIVSGAVVQALKTIAGRQRPYLGPDDAGDFQIGHGMRGGMTSFPSGHTAAAFSAATVLTLQTAHRWPAARWVAGPLLYGGATMVAFSRMYDSKHWASDVVLGAGIGTVSALRVMRWNVAHPDNRIARWLAGASIVPTAHGAALVVGR
jgi:membrane-associated phospholipid phosphatase